jgi:hypothetical protein
MKTKPKSPEFWLTNISNRDVSIADLNLTVRSFSSVNLLDKKHYSYTLEQLQASATSGSVFKKKHCLVVRKVAPETIKMNIPLAEETYIPTRERSVLEIHEEKYDELNVSDEQFANENAELAELDRKKIL